MWRCSAFYEGDLIKPSVTLLTFASHGFYQQQNSLVESAQKAGITRCRTWSDATFRQTAFFADNKDILESSRGQGFWLWKPYLINHELERLKTGEFLVYYDVGRPSIPHRIHKSLLPLLEWCSDRNGGMLPGTYIPEYGRNAKWTKRECFVAMGCDIPLYWEHPQIQATYSIWQKSESSLAFVSEWLSWCMKPAALSDQISMPEVSNFDDFVDHRHDQSILTNLAVMRGLKCYGDPHTSLPGSKNINNLVDRVQGKRLSIHIRNARTFVARQFNQRVLGK